MRDSMHSAPLRVGRSVSMDLTEDTAECIPLETPAASDSVPAGLRNAWQWLAMITMIVDHIGYFYNISALRYVGRFGMPLYAMLFVITIRNRQFKLGRILLLGALSQYQYMYIFGEPQLNIIFGFAIFAWTAEGIRRRHWLTIIAGLLLMLIPVSYDWYLYLTLATFYWIEPKAAQRGAFAVLTGVYVYLSYVGNYAYWWRQLLAIGAPFIEGIKAPRPNKYLYRYFYPGHLLILAVMQYMLIGTPWLSFDRYDPPQVDYRYDAHDDWGNEGIDPDDYDWVDETPTD